MICSHFAPFCGCDDWCLFDIEVTVNRVTMMMSFLIQFLRFDVNLYDILFCAESIWFEECLCADGDCDSTNSVPLKLYRECPFVCCSVLFCE